MIYSVWSYDRRAYDYYEAPGPRGTHAEAPSAPALRHRIGATPEGAAWKLPFGAKKIGSGEMPRGRIATSGLQLSGIGDLDLTNPTHVVVAAGLGYAAYLAWRRLR